MRLAALFLAAGCLAPWDTGGPWACQPDGGCAAGYRCDDGVCCVPGGAPRCPTLPDPDGGCAGQPPRLRYLDLDGDGAGDPSTALWGCRPPASGVWVFTGGDCDDRAATVGPTALERCNGRDDTCDGVIDEGLASRAWYRDADGDGYGESCAACTVLACGAPDGHAARGGDCDDGDPARHPGATERCDGVDDDCNGVADDPPFLDVESPGSPTVASCTVAGLSGRCAEGGLQCVPASSGAGGVPTCVPRAGPRPERCDDGVDDDCDGVVDGQPGCGGPRSLTSIPGGRYRAARLDAVAATATGLPPRCVAEEPATPMAWLNPAWVGSGGGLHLFSASAPEGLPWDVSAPGATLVLDLRLTGLVNPHPSGWEPTSPVVTLCGAAPSAYVRLWPTSPVFDGSLTVALPVNGTAAGWNRETGPVALDLTRVRSVELVVAPVAPASGTVTFTLEWRPDAGFR